MIREYTWGSKCCKPYEVYFSVRWFRTVTMNLVSLISELAVEEAATGHAEAHTAVG